MSELIADLLNEAHTKMVPREKLPPPIREMVHSGVASFLAPHIPPTDNTEIVTHKRRGALDRAAVKAAVPRMLSGQNVSRDELRSDVRRPEHTGYKERIVDGVKIVIADLFSPEQIADARFALVYNRALTALAPFLEGQVSTKAMGEDFPTIIRNATIEHISLLKDTLGKWDERTIVAATEEDLRQEIASSYQQNISWVSSRHPEINHDNDYLRQRELAQRIKLMPGMVVPIYLNFDPPYASQGEKPFVSFEPLRKAGIYHYDSTGKLELSVLL